MTWLKSLIASTALALAVAAPTAAEARFGQSDSDRHESSRSSSSDDDSSSSSSGSETHYAVPASAPSPSYDYHPSDRRVSVRPSGYRYYGQPYHPHYHHGWVFGYEPFFYAPAPAPVVVIEPPPEAAPVLPTASFGFDAHGHGLGATLGFNMAIEGERWGVNGVFSAAFYSNGDGTFDPESTKLFDMHLTYALLSGSHGRLRFELGGNGIVAPQLAVLGPDAGVSLALAIVGPLGIEAAAYATPWPHQRYQGNAGLTLTLGHLGLRAGWKQLWMSDNGYVDGVVHSDNFVGPYFGMGFVF